MTGHQLRAIALSFQGTTEAAHFDRRAFKVHRIFATLAADEQSANLLLTPEGQEFYVGLKPTAFRRLPNRWGDQGWTSVSLAGVDADLMREALEKAWQAATRSTKSRSRRD
ncbi:MmcQ/YjbR family DNA-binding protein [Bradyrhizobium ontarionense]|uniref:MmcQ/YjbR family DNA-binding protein n=1 Tax=Bradyrhizobium ontarionense TaxID=2898149 RepID=A0ABY3R3L2_9BRAD|nr:MmcQ/YjbR family DNA-binding protein [Bradyrhizobium sp. A19]UFZ01884.1 MmcQ/YjbR family DNA-binding protein [Bradyrhizobium sp. A19]